jgi:hypothetical protein
MMHDREKSERTVVRAAAAAAGDTKAAPLQKYVPPCSLTRLFNGLVRLEAGAHSGQGRHVVLLYMMRVPGAGPEGGSPRGGGLGPGRVRGTAPGIRRCRCYCRV